MKKKLHVAQLDVLQSFSYTLLAHQTTGFLMTGWHIGNQPHDRNWLLGCRRGDSRLVCIGSVLLFSYYTLWAINLYFTYPPAGGNKFGGIFVDSRQCHRRCRKKYWRVALFYIFSYRLMYIKTGVLYSRKEWLSVDLYLICFSFFFVLPVGRIWAKCSSRNSKLTSC